MCGDRCVNNNSIMDLFKFYFSSYLGVFKQQDLMKSSERGMEVYIRQTLPETYRLVLRYVLCYNNIVCDYTSYILISFLTNMLNIWVYLFFISVCLCAFIGMDEKKNILRVKWMAHWAPYKKQSS